MAIDVGFVSHEAAVCVDMLRNDWVKVGGGNAGNLEATDVSAALDKGHQGGFRRDRRESAVFGFTADIGFIGFDGRAGAPKRPAK